jgi:hypothetical protein
MLMPRITDGTRELLSATDDFAFKGVVSPLLHPSIDRETAFSAVGAPMPASELLLPDLSAVRAIVLASSLHRVIYDLLHASDLQNPITHVANPRLYMDLLSLGKKASKAHSQGKVIDEADERAGIYAAAYTVFQDFSCQFDRDGTKFIMSRLKQAGPKLAPGETEQERQQSQLEKANKRLFVWRYARTIAFTGTMSLMSITSHINASEARRDNDVRVEALEGLFDASHASQDQINELAELKAEGQSDALQYGILAAGGLGRFFMWRLHPKQAR